MKFPQGYRRLSLIAVLILFTITIAWSQAQPDQATPRCGEQRERPEANRCPCDLAGANLGGVLYRNLELTDEQQCILREAQEANREDIRKNSEKIRVAR